MRTNFFIKVSISLIEEECCFMESFLQLFAVDSMAHPSVQSFDHGLSPFQLKKMLMMGENLKVSGGVSQKQEELPSVSFFEDGKLSAQPQHLFDEAPSNKVSKVLIENCWSCNADNYAESNFCRMCGEKQNTKCKSCKATNLLGFRFCSTCGFNASVSVPSVSVPSVSVPSVSRRLFQLEPQSASVGVVIPPSILEEVSSSESCEDEFHFDDCESDSGLDGELEPESDDSSVVTAVNAWSAPLKIEAAPKTSVPRMRLVETTVEKATPTTATVTPSKTETKKTDVKPKKTVNNNNSFQLVGKPAKVQQPKHTPVAIVPKPVVKEEPVVVKPKVTVTPIVKPVVQPKPKQPTKVGNKKKSKKIDDDLIYDHCICNRWRQKGFCKARVCSYSHPEEWKGRGLMLIAQAEAAAVAVSSPVKQTEKKNKKSKK